MMPAGETMAMRSPGRNGAGYMGLFIGGLVYLNFYAGLAYAGGNCLEFVSIDLD